MLSIRCKECGREVSGHPTQARSCGCPNMATVMGDSITAVDLNKVVMLNSGKLSLIHILTLPTKRIV